MTGPEINPRQLIEGAGRLSDVAARFGHGALQVAGLEHPRDKISDGESGSLADIEPYVENGKIEMIIPLNHTDVLPSFMANQAASRLDSREILNTTTHLLLTEIRPMEGGNLGQQFDETRDSLGALAATLKQRTNGYFHIETSGGPIFIDYDSKDATVMGQAYNGLGSAIRQFEADTPDARPEDRGVLVKLPHAMARDAFGIRVDDDDAFGGVQIKRPIRLSGTPYSTEWETAKPHPGEIPLESFRTIPPTG